MLFLSKYASDLICILPFESSSLYEQLKNIYEDIFISFKNEEERELIKEPKIYMDKILYLEKEDAAYIKYLYGGRDGFKEPFELDLNDLYLKINNPLINDNNHKIIEMCNLKMEYHDNLLPIYECPDNLDSFTYLKKLCIIGLKNIFGSQVGSFYQERLKYELDIINKMGFCNYFLIVYDYVKFAKENGIPVSYTPSANAKAVAEYTIALILDAVKKITYSNNEVRNKEWNKIKSLSKSFLPPNVEYMPYFNCKPNALKNFS